MERITLREASERTARSITTLRRYIRSGRLHAEKRDGRFGPEYFVSEEDLAGAGLANSVSTGLVRSPSAARAVAPLPAAGAGGVPMTLYQELQMKHEQLLVQYGMIRAGGMRAMELQNENRSLKRQLQEQSSLLERGRRRISVESSALKRELRAAHLELEGRALQISALEEKVRALEMLTRNSATTESIEQQFRDVMKQSRRVGQIRDADKVWSPGTARSLRRDPGDSTRDPTLARDRTRDPERTDH